MIFEYFFKIGSWSKLTESNSSSFCQIVSFIDKCLIVIFKFIVLLFHASHSDNGSIKHLFEHGDIIFKYFKLRRFLDLFDV